MSDSKTNSWESYSWKDHGEGFLTGASIGITGMLISSVSQELTGHKLGYGKIGLKNAFKISLSSGVITCFVMRVAKYVNKKG